LELHGFRPAVIRLGERQVNRRFEIAAAARKVRRRLAPPDAGEEGVEKIGETARTTVAETFERIGGLLLRAVALLRFSLL
jgi:hypothetical protein